MQLSKHNRVQQIWVPGYEGTDGNKMADLMSKLGSEYPFRGPEPACSISMGVANQSSQETFGFITWTQTGKTSHTGTLCQNRDQLRSVVGLLTGHCHLKGHLFKLGLANNFTCERCIEKEESDTYIV
jgi:hypothetical protein